MSFDFDILLRLLLAGILGGIIGFEREHTNRPAGFRTHILVCVGAALVMITSQFIYDKYHLSANLDPARLGAQVISGIGFLGAGTIIRDGFNVRGLTTAASLWAVSCVGIAAGIGFYGGAVIATALIILTLIVLKRTELLLIKKNKYRVIFIESENKSGQIGLISCIFDKYNIDISNMDISKNKDNRLLIKLLVKTQGGLLDKQAFDDLYEIQGITKVYEE